MPTYDDMAEQAPDLSLEEMVRRLRAKGRQGQARGNVGVTIGKPVMQMPPMTVPVDRAQPQGGPPMASRGMDVQIGEHTRYRGLPGLIGNRIALQVNEVVEDVPLGFIPHSSAHLNKVTPVLPLPVAAASPSDDAKSDDGE